MIHRSYLTTLDRASLFADSGRISLSVTLGMMAPKERTIAPRQISTTSRRGTLRPFLPLVLMLLLGILERSLAVDSECSSYLAQSDVNQDGNLDKDEYISFVDELSNGAYLDVFLLSFDELPTEVQLNYFNYSCTRCTNDPSCACHDASEGIDIFGFTKGQSADQWSLLENFCFQTRLAIGNSQAKARDATVPVSSPVIDTKSYYLGVPSVESTLQLRQASTPAPTPSYLQCSIAMTIADLDHDSLLNQDEYVGLINRLSGNQFSNAFFFLPVIMQSTYSELQYNGAFAGINVNGSKPGDIPTDAQLADLENICNAIVGAINFVLYGETTPVSTPTPTAVPIPSATTAAPAINSTPNPTMAATPDPTTTAPVTPAPIVATTPVPTLPKTLAPTAAPTPIPTIVAATPIPTVATTPTPTMAATTIPIVAITPTPTVAATKTPIPAPTPTPKSVKPTTPISESLTDPPSSLLSLAPASFIGNVTFKISNANGFTADVLRFGGIRNSLQRSMNVMLIEIINNASKSSRQLRGRRRLRGTYLEDSASIDALRDINCTQGIPQGRNCQSASASFKWLVSNEAAAQFYSKKVQSAIESKKLQASLDMDSPDSLITIEEGSGIVRESTFFGPFSTTDKSFWTPPKIAAISCCCIFMMLILVLWCCSKR